MLILIPSTASHSPSCIIRVQEASQWRTHQVDSVSPHTKKKNEIRLFFLSKD
jgi:hypothetical protein